MLSPNSLISTCKTNERPKGCPVKKFIFPPKKFNFSEHSPVDEFLTENEIV